MKDQFIVKIPDKDDLVIGPFETYEIAEEWHRRSVFRADKAEINLLIGPRPDHEQVIRKY